MIGSWVIRILRRTPPPQGGWWTADHGKAHLVESEVTDRLVMRCGRQLKLETANGRLEEFVARTLEPRCKQCQGRS